MAALWTDEAKWERWLQVEIAVVRAWAEEGVVPAADAQLIARNARVVVADIDRYQQEVQHDTLAFLRSVNDHLGPEGRWVHHGLTSNDVWDTATALHLRDAAALLAKDLQRLHDALVVQALRHKDTLITGRTHGVHAEPTTFGLKLAGWVDEVRRHQARLEEAARGVEVGKISGAVGTHASVPPVVEERVCASLGWDWRRCPTRWSSATGTRTS